MTVSSELNRKQYTGDGATTSFATSPVIFFDTSDLTVYVVTTATGAATTLTENTHYTVTGGDGSTGTVSLAGGSSPYGAPAATQTLVIVRDVPLTQATDLVQNDASDAEVLEDALDKLTMISQQLSTRLDRSFVLADSDVSGASGTLPTPTATSLLGWTGAGTALQNYSTSTLSAALTTAFTLTLLDDADASAFVETLVDGATAETAPATGDLVLLSDVSANNGRKMTLANLLTVVNALTADATPDSAADYLLSYDASATAAKKVLMSAAPWPLKSVLAAKGSLISASAASTPVERAVGTDGYALIADSSQASGLNYGTRSAIMSFMANATVADGTTNYMSSATTSTSEADVSVQVPFACTVKNLYCARSAGGAGTATFTLRKASGDTALTAAISGAGTTASDIVNSVTFAAGDLIDMKVVLTGGATTAVHKATVEVIKTSA